jgi:hypothetical protein
MPDPGRRLDSWKEIAAHVQRDVRTVARWEKERGLPVHRVPGSRGQVFAFTTEIDRWLTSADGETATKVIAAAGASATSRPRWRLVAAPVVVAVLTLAVVVGTGLLGRGEPIVAVDVQHNELVARTVSGEAWRYAFSGPVRIGGDTIERTAIVDLDGDGSAEVLAVLGRPSTGPDDESLYCFSSSGALMWQRRMDATLRFAAGEFTSPWNAGPVRAFETAGGWRIVWLTHHHTWWPAIVVMYDPAGTEKGRFVHAGWITETAGLPDGRLVISGVSNQHDADVVALLDAQSWDGAGPPSEGGYECRNCPAGRPVRYFVLPRSELSRTAGTARQRAQIHVFADMIQVHIVQVPGGDADVIYEFSRELELRRIRPSDAYWAWHAELEASGAVGHSAAVCPERAGATARLWERGRGWSDVRGAGLQK